MWNELLKGDWQMKSQTVQELVKKVFGDEKTKRQFMSNPDSVLAQFALTEQEKRAVLKTHAKLGLVTSNSQQLEAAIDPTAIWHAPIP
jgi:hypothetical protein